MDRMAKLVCILLASLMLGALPAAAEPDPDCVQDMTQTIGRERQRVAIYLGQLKNMTDNTVATRGASICSTSLARAETYYKRATDDEDICDVGTTYIDSQVVQLFRSATGSCRQQFDAVGRSLSAEEQRAMRETVDRALHDVK